MLVVLDVLALVSMVAGIFLGLGVALWILVVVGLGSATKKAENGSEVSENTAERVVAK